MTEYELLSRAIDLSQESVGLGGYPVGAVVALDGLLLSEGISNGKQLCDPTSHAEIVAIRQACQKQEARNLPHATLFSSLEPCIMCLTASFWAGIPKIVFAASRERVSAQHFEGTHAAREINDLFRSPRELVHHESLEDRALDIIYRWGQ